MAAGACIDDGGKIPGKIVGVTASIKQGKGKGDLQSDLRRSDELAVPPELTQNRDFAAGSDCVQERLAIASKSNTMSSYAWKQRDAFPIGEGDLVDSALFSSQDNAKQVMSTGVHVGD